MARPYLHVVGVLAKAGDEAHGRRGAGDRARQDVEVWQRGDDTQLRLGGTRCHLRQDQGRGERGAARETPRERADAGGYPP
ncbi:MAG: hypothetical protein AUH99_02890 [Candidatus Rokubacteria bacterium 13_2_20CM_2_70_11]|nr:MAG: hypothetical protein AUH99_02890 [Candidatus Rokubacteria bacterium 13_2_20CM_2_70_11]